MKICKTCGADIDDYAITCPNCKSPCNYQIPASSSSRSHQRQENASYPSYGQDYSTYPSYGQGYSSNQSYGQGYSSNQVIHCVVSNKPEEAAPVWKLKTDRSLLLYIFLGVITFGIYPLVVMSSISSDINTIAGRHDGKNTMNFCLMFFVFSWLTLGIYPLVWYHQLSARIGAELQRRDIPYSFGAGNFWGWYVLGIFLLGIGPIIYCYQLFRSMNMLSVDYNNRG